MITNPYPVSPFDNGVKTRQAEAFDIGFHDGSHGLPFQKRRYFPTWLYSPYWEGYTAGQKTKR